MKTRASALALALALAVAAMGAAPASAAAQNMTGVWQIVFEGRGGTVTQTLDVQQEGSTLSGTISFQGGGPGGPGGGAPGPIEITDGSVDGATFSFRVTIEAGDRGSFSQVFSGTYESDFMEGTIEGGRGGARPFMGTRAD